MYILDIVVHQHLVFLLLYFLLLLLLSISLSTPYEDSVESACVQLFLMCRRIGDYISLELFYIVFCSASRDHFVLLGTTCSFRPVQHYVFISSCSAPRVHFVLFSTTCSFRSVQHHSFCSAPRVLPLCR